MIKMDNEEIVIIILFVIIFIIYLYFKSRGTV